MLLDPRAPYVSAGAIGTPVYGWGGQQILCLRQAPLTTNAANIVAATAPASVNMINLNNNPPAAGVTRVTNFRRNDNGLVGTVYAIDGSVGIINYGGSPTTSILPYTTSTAVPAGTATVRCYDPRTMVRRNVVVTANAADVGGGHTMTIRGFDLYGYPMTEVISIAATPQAGNKCFKYIQQVVPNWSSANTLTVGTGDKYGFPIRVDDFGSVAISWTPTGVITSSANFVAADPTIPNANNGGDVRGSFTQTGANGTTNVLIFAVSIPPWNLLPNVPTSPATNANAWQGLFGVYNFADF
jgi:hypothetical protein